MDIAYFLRQRLKFIEHLYEQSTETFHEAKRKIEAGEPPFVNQSNPEDYDGTPPFLDEWLQADECMASCGQWAVMLLSSALHEYLREFTKEMSSRYGYRVPELRDYEVRLKECQKNKKGWFPGYRKLFLDLYKINWGDGPDVTEGLEHLVLTRNDFEHQEGLWTGYVYQTAKHKQKHSEGFFTSTDGVFWNDEVRLVVDKQRLHIAVESVGAFCTWLEQCLVYYPDYLRGLVGAS